MGQKNPLSEKPLNQFVPGETGVVYKINVTGVAKRRLFDMGITPGIQITFRKMAPLGDPVEITVRGYELSIRRSEAKAILMKQGGGQR